MVHEETRKAPGSTRKLLIGAGVVVALIALVSMLLRPRCTPETCGPAVGAEVRDLIALQEVHRVQHGAYATSFEELGFSPLPPVAIELLHADTAGWIARGTRPELEGMSCVAWQGVVPERPRTGLGRIAEEAGRSYCDFPT